MASPINNTPLTTELAFRVDDSSAFLSQKVIHQETTLTETTRGISTATHMFQVRDSSSFKKLLNIVNAGGTPVMYFRFGYDTMWYPVQYHFIKHVSAMPTTTAVGETYKVETADLMYPMSIVNRTTAYKGLLSDMVNTICASNGITSTVIEPTSYSQSLVQSYMSDYDFILNRVMGRSSNKKGISGYRLYFQDRTLHFHTPSFYTDVKEIDIFSPTGIESVVQSDSSQELIKVGAAGIRSITYDPLSGIAETVDYDPTKVENYANVDNYIEGVNLVPIFRHISETGRTAEAASIVQSIYSTNRNTFRAKLTLPCSPGIRAGDFINVVQYDVSSVASQWSGLYYVNSVIHHVDTSNGMSSSVLNLERGEFYGNKNDSDNPGTLLNASNLLNSKNVTDGDTIKMENPSGGSTVVRAVDVTPDKLTQTIQTVSQTITKSESFPTDAFLIT